MQDLATSLITLGGLFLIGLLTDLLGRRTPLPRVTLLLLFGFLIGPGALDLLPDLSRTWFPLASDLALMMVGFLLGGSLGVPALRAHGREVLGVSGAVVLATALLIVVGLLFLGVRLDLALLLGAISTSTAPAATVDVVHECRARGPFSQTLLGIVAVDDAWGLMLFSLLLALAQGINGEAGSLDILQAGVMDVFGAIGLGIALGAPMAYLTGRIQRGEPTQVEALGMVLLCGGLALRLEVSFVLTSMVMGIVVTNLARHHRRPFHAIEGIEWPFIVLFFVLAGASLHLTAVAHIGVVGSAYVALRILGRMVGAYVGARAAGANSGMRRWMGLALMPQAGVAIGMALVAARRFPALAEDLMAIVISATVLFEIAGPPMTRLALTRVGEVGMEPESAPPDDDD